MDKDIKKKISKFDMSYKKDVEDVMDECDKALKK